MIYDPEANILCIELSAGKISYVLEIGKFLIHISKAGKPILVEILDASKFIGQIDKLKKINSLKDIKKIAPAS